MPLADFVAVDEDPALIIHPAEPDVQTGLDLLGGQLDTAAESGGFVWGQLSGVIIALDLDLGPIAVGEILGHLFQSFRAGTCPPDA